MKNKIFVTLLSLSLLFSCKQKADQETNKTVPQKQEVKKVPQPKTVAKIDTSLPGDAEKGKVHFTKLCVACHGADGKGNGGVTAADFIKDTSRLAQDNSVLFNSIKNGKVNGSRVMPPHKGVLKDDEIKDVISYLRKTFGSK